MLGSTYNALFLDEYGRICCNECGAVDLEVEPRGTGLRLGGDGSMTERTES
jgi:hypothetical protein